FAYHGYPWLIHRLTYRRNGHDNLHVRGYKEEGTTTTPFDMVMLNDLDRFHLVMDVIDRVEGLGTRYAGLRQEMEDRRFDARAHARASGEDLPEVSQWVWPDSGNTASERQAAAATGGDNEELPAPTPRPDSAGRVAPARYERVRVETSAQPCSTRGTRDRSTSATSHIRRAATGSVM